ncbi:MAG: hypothetical protein HUU21_16565 [Polyangiaceae bacterium]|nr:hypothetical protein [Polyangiaceae bacterium]NUQ75164.1 hypothetical protein [Polyangiaceae bacterium]
MRTIQYGFAFVFLFVAVFTGGPLGCDLLKPPELPGMEAPEAPEAPDVKAPDAPPGAAGDDAGACCIRRASGAEKACPQGQDRCCSMSVDADKCEELNGSWFREARDCSMMC